MSYPLTFGRKMKSHGLGIGPTGISIRVGPSRRAKTRLSALRNSSGVRARSPDGPNAPPHKAALARAPQFLRRARAFAGRAKRLRELHEVRIGKIARDQPVAVAL